MLSARGHALSLFLPSPASGCGEIGIHAGFRCLWALRPWRFESSQPHEKAPLAAGPFLSQCLRLACLTQVVFLRPFSRSHFASALACLTQSVFFVPRCFSHLARAVASFLACSQSA